MSQSSNPVVWAGLHMPFLNAAIAAWDCPKGTTINIAMPFDAKLAAACTLLAEKGCRVVLCDTEFGDPSLFDGIDVQIVDADTYANTRADFVFDRLGRVVSHVAKTVSTICAPAWDRPVADLSEAQIHAELYEHIGVGQAATMALVDITNLQLAGRPVAVLGFGGIGAGVARHVTALGGRVTVVADDPIDRMRAQTAGYHIGPLHSHDVVITTEGTPPAVADLIDGAIVCHAGHPWHQPLAKLHDLPRQRVRAAVDAVTLTGGRNIHLIAEGKPLHLAAADGIAIETADKILALHVLACQFPVAEVEGRLARMARALDKDTTE